jgi:acyl-CoA hydrolase/GNAT superfamily N-acetyltransferase
MGALADWQTLYPAKFAPVDEVFGHIRRGDHIFIASGCGEPQYLVREMTRFVEENPKAFFDAEVVQVYSFGIAPYTDVKFKSNFRHNSFFIGDNTRGPVNQGHADYSPVSLSDVPALINSGRVRCEVALIQTSLPDAHGFLSLGVSVDMVKAATEKARLVVAQVNPRMPRVHGDGFIHIEKIDFLVPCEEPLLEMKEDIAGETAQRIGSYVARLVQDGDTIQVGYGGLPNAIMKNLFDRRHLGVHTELLGDGLVALMKAGVIDNSRKNVNRGKAVAAFAMGTEETYRYIDDNPSISFRTIDYTNNALVIAQHDRMVAINSALQIDLTGQASSESIAGMFYSGVGGHQDFMRGAVMARRGRTILAIRATAQNDTISRIVPALSAGAGVTLNRGDVRYVVTEYGIAYLHGKNVRERAMSLIAIAHPKFRPWLIEEAKKLDLIFRDQAFIPGRRGEYPEQLEAYRTTRTGVQLTFRPVKISDEPLLKDFFYSLSDRSLYRRFMSMRKDMPHERLQDFVVIDYTRELVILAVVGAEDNELIVGVGQYGIDEATHTAEMAFAVRDEFQNQGIGTELLGYLGYLGRREGLLGFTAEVLTENQPMLHVFEKGGYDIVKKFESGVCEMKLAFRG